MTFEEVPDTDPSELCVYIPQALAVPFPHWGPFRGPLRPAASCDTGEAITDLVRQYSCLNLLTTNGTFTESSSVLVVQSGQP